jgi:hypothetical protein
MQFTVQGSGSTTGECRVDNTGAWETVVEYNCGTIELSQGLSVLRVEILDDGLNYHGLTLEFLGPSPDETILLGGRLYDKYEGHTCEGMNELGSGNSSSEAACEAGTGPADRQTPARTARARAQEWGGWRGGA